MFQPCLIAGGYTWYRTFLSNAMLHCYITSWLCTLFDLDHLCLRDHFDMLTHLHFCHDWSDLVRVSVYIYCFIYLFIMHIYPCLINDILYTTYPWFIISLYILCMYIYICIYDDLYQWSQRCSSWISSPFPQSRRSLLISSLSPQKGSRLKGVCRTPQKL